MSTQTTAKTWQIPTPGTLDSLTLQTTTLPPPSNTEIRVRVHAIGLNFADVFCCLGLYEAFQKAGATVPGLEFAGVCETEGGAFKVGDRVVGTTRFGAYTTHINASTAYLRPLPQNWTFAEGAAFPVQTLTAYYALRELGALKKNSKYTILVQSAAGGVGLQTLRILETFPNVSVLGVVGNEEKIEFLKSKFPSTEGKRRNWAFISRNSKMDFGTQLKNYLLEYSLPGFDLILDSVGGPYLAPSYNSLLPCGRHILFGAASLAPPSLNLSPLTLTFYHPRNIYHVLTLAYKFLTRPRIDPMKLVGDNKSIMGFNLIWVYDKLDLLSELYEELDGMGLERPFVGHKFGFEEVPEALAFFQTGKTVGKVIIEVEHDE